MELSDRSGRELEERSPAAAGNAHWVSADKSRGKNHPKPQFSPCYRCGGKHSAAKCKFKDAECFHCGKKGHIARVCRSKQREPQAGERPSRKKQHTNNLMTDQPEEQASCDDEPVYSQFQLTDPCQQAASCASRGKRQNLGHGGRHWCLAVHHF